MSPILTLESIWRWSGLAVILVVTLGGCAPTIEKTVSTDPTRFNLKPAAVPPLRTKSVALKNAYQASTVVGIPNKDADSVPLPLQRPVTPRWSSDLKALTDTATVMLGRSLEKQGVVVSAAGQKAVTFAVTVLNYEDVFLQGIRFRVIVEARYPDGTKSVKEGTDTSGTVVGRALDGAVVAALNDLLGDAQFVAYMNAPD